MEPKQANQHFIRHGLFISSTLIFILFTTVALHGQTLRIAVMPEGSSKWGYVDEKGKTVAEPQFHYCDAYTPDGITVVSLDADFMHCQLVDTAGNPIPVNMKISLRLDRWIGTVSGFRAGLLIVHREFILGAINTRGELVVPFEYKELTSFECGYALGRKKNRYYLIDRYGNSKQLSPELKIKNPRHFSEGLAPVEIDGKFGFIDTLGNLAIEARFLSVGYFYAGVAWARDISQRIGFINSKGDWVVKPKYTMARNCDPESKLAMVHLGDETLYIDPDGKEYRFTGSDRPYRFFDGMAIGRKGELLGYIDPTGKWVVEPRFHTARAFENGYARVEIDGKWGLIDKSGNWVLLPVYKEIGKVSVLGQENISVDDK